MFRFLILFTASILIPFVRAQNNYVIWSSVVVLSAGDHTPLTLGTSPATLTSLGAQQLYLDGQFFRERYITDVTSNQTAAAPLVGLNPYTVDDEQTYVLALDEQYTVASAQAFMQGFYPPFALNTTTSGMIQSTSFLANGTYVDGPLNGMQFPQYHTANGLDPDYIYVGGDLDCPSLDQFTEYYYTSPEYEALASSSQSLYDAIGAQFLADLLPPSEWSYSNAWVIWDYMYYLSVHNFTSAALLNSSSYINSTTGIPDLTTLRSLASTQQYAFLGNTTAANPYGAVPSIAAGSSSISTIAGSTLATAILSQLTTPNTATTSDTPYKLSILVGDFDPLLSFFALTSLPSLNANFLSLPEPGSALVFELFSTTNASTSASDLSSLPMPPTSDLYIRFSFRNGSDPAPINGLSTSPGASLQSFPLFNRGPSETDIPYEEFVHLMTDISIADPGDWCAQCGALNLFCAAWNSSDGVNGSTTTPTSGSGGVSAPVAGVIGAVVALVLAGLVAALLALLAGFRVSRVSRGRSRGDGVGGSLGGFKGSRKLASDADLTFHKGGAVIVGASVEKKRDSDTTVVGADGFGNERVGSWELRARDKDVGAGVGDGSRRSSFELNQDGVDPLEDPVRERESV